ncbi:putative uncharacterized protein DDB_G0271982 [Atheta coriaria]|uniref:putative uncharacterized protein DDB_G0271982 n=1 Tax=Dalotia coriaria TaxID=877792 RepID=UPI0031F39343
MNETIANSTTSVRSGKDLSLDSPLLNLILAASLLSRITRSKSPPPSYSRTPPLPLRYSENYYEALPWYPHDAQHYYKLQTSLNAQQTSYPIRQHIIHIHQRPLKEKPNLNQNGGDNVNNVMQTTTTAVGTEMPKVEENSTETLNSQKIDDEMVGSSSNQLTQELKDFLTDFFRKNVPTIQQIQSQNSAAPEISNSENNKVVDGLPEITLDQISQEMSENGPEVTSDQLVENMSETMVDKIAENLSENATENEVKHMSESVIQNLPTSILENIPPEMLEKISEKISEQISEKLSEKFSKDVSNHMLEKLAQLIPDTNKPADDTVLETYSENQSKENEINRDSQENFPVISENEGELPEKDSHIKFVDTENSETATDADYREGAASSIDLQASETQKSQNTKNSRTTDDEYVFAGDEEDEDDEEDDDDTIEEPEMDVEQNLPKRVSPKFSQKIRITTESTLRKNSKGKLSQNHEQTQERINSKKPSPNKRRTTPATLIYDEYDQATPVTQKKKVQYYNGNIKNPNQRKPKPTDNEYDDEETPQRQIQGQGQSKPKNNKNSQRRRTTTTTTPTYDEYYNDPVDQDYSGQDQNNPDYEEEVTTKPRPGRRTTRRAIQRQQDITTVPTTVTDTDLTDATTLTPTTPSTTTTMSAANATSGEYPYYGNNNYNNISITYGPPVHHYPGYGPSNGNEQISFTYAPPSSSGQGGNLGGFTAVSGGGASGSGVAAAGVAPMLDSWYNQYARTSMYKRIQDLLTPNNFYNQYDVNYNDPSV